MPLDTLSLERDPWRATRGPARGDHGGRTLPAASAQHRPEQDDAAAGQKGHRRRRPAGQAGGSQGQKGSGILMCEGFIGEGTGLRPIPGVVGLGS